MDCNNYEDKIISYIENKLSAEERIQFQTELNSNSNLKAQHDEMRKILISLNKMPKVEASSDFMVKLNAKIDNHEFKSTNKISSFFNKIINYEYLPRLSVGMASLVFLFVVTYFWSSNNSGLRIMLSNSSSVVDSLNNEIANLDSLDKKQDASIIIDK